MVHIGDVSMTHLFYQENKQHDLVINNKTYKWYAEECVYPTSEPAYSATKLFYDAYDCYEHRQEPFKDKAKKFWGSNKSEIYKITYLVLLFGMAVAFYCVGVKEGRKEAEKQQFKQEIIKEAQEQFKKQQQNNTIKLSDLIKQR